MAYNFYRTVTIDNTRVLENLTNYPFLFNSTLSDLKSVANGGHVSRDNGDDICFAKNSDGSEPLDFEIEKYDPTAGELVAHIRVPLLSSSQDTTFYLLYGNSNSPTLVQIGTDGTTVLDTFGNINFPAFRDALWTFDGKQYASYITSAGALRIGQRDLPDGSWTFYTVVTGIDITDHHKCAHLGVDRDGYIHVCYGMHGSALVYKRSDDPEDVSAFSNASMTGSNENSVTYPTFFTAGVDFFFIYRNGVAANGEAYLNKYDHNTKVWSALHHPFINTVAESRNPYWNNISIDSNGYVHISWCWRDGDEQQNHDVCYAKSEDGCTTWKKSDGTVYSIPITYATAEILDPTGVNNSLSNQSGMDVDGNNHPHIIYLKEDGASDVHIYHAWHNGSVWSITKISLEPLVWHQGSGGSRPVIAVDRTSNIAYVIYRSRNEGNYLRVLKSNSTFSSWSLLNPYAFERSENWEPIYDRQRWPTDGQLDILVEKGLSDIRILGWDPAKWDFQENPEGIWDTNFKGVWHLEESSGTIYDSTPNNINSTGLAGLTYGQTGQISPAITFSGASSSRISFGDKIDVSTNGQITLEAWVNVDVFPLSGYQIYFIGKGYDGSLEAYFLRVRNIVGTLKLQAGSYDGTEHLTSWDITGWNIGEWHYIVGLYTGTAWKVFFDGAEKAATTTDGPELNDKELALGAFDNNGVWARPFDGLLDESRISNVARLAYIPTTYNNQSSPSSFYSIGTEFVPILLGLYLPIQLDGMSYWYERGSYFHLRGKDSEESYAITKTLHHVEGGLNPQRWQMNIICPNRTSLNALETSYQKVTYANRVLAFIDRLGVSHLVYFSELGPVENLDLKATVFRAPIVLVEEVVA